MNTLTFKILLNDYTFQVYSTSKHVQCSYYTQNKYNAILVFAENTYARLSYKNVTFHGTSTKRDNWRIRLNGHQIICKKYNSYYFKSSDHSNENTHKMIESTIESFPNNVLNLYNETINYLSDYYSCIENKKIFQQQLWHL